MNFRLIGITVVLVMLIDWIPEVISKNHKIRIIVPHKINYIHHHHHPKKIYPEQHEEHHYDNEEEEEDEEEEENVEDIETEGSQRGMPYYAMPASNAFRFIMKPVLLYNEFERIKYPKDEYDSDEDFLQRPRLPEVTHPFFGYHDYDLYWPM